MSTELTKIQENDVYYPNLQPTKDVNTDNIKIIFSIIGKAAERANFPWAFSIAE